MRHVRSHDLSYFLPVLSRKQEVAASLTAWFPVGLLLFPGIIAANALVFLCWRVPPLQRSMFRYFTSNPASSKPSCRTYFLFLLVRSSSSSSSSSAPPTETLCTPMILSSFSHFSFLHMAANMYVLWSFSTSAVSMWGREQFLAVYLSAGMSCCCALIGSAASTHSPVSSGVISSLVSYACKMATGRFGPSLGAVSTSESLLGALLRGCDLIGCLLSLAPSWPS